MDDRSSISGKEGKFALRHSVQTDSGTYPGTGDSSPEGKTAGV